MIGWDISLEKGEEEDQGVYPRKSNQGSEKACKFGSISLIYLILIIHDPIQGQKPMLLGPNIWSNYSMLLGPIHGP